jgi:tetraacyldisaccharide 4'-kinase
MRAPEFWSGRGAVSTILLPVSWVYGLATALRVARKPVYAPPIPVICVGNISVGGSGKTPTAIAVVNMLLEDGRKPHFLTRGYRGRLSGPVLVDPAIHTSVDVGDEPFLLARHAPTWVARNRAAGAKAAVEGGASVLVMDDGHQNPSVRKDLSLIVIDGGYGFGNRRVIPAGPLREPIGAGLKRAEAIVLIGEDKAEAASFFGSHTCLSAHIVPSESAMALAGQKVVAVAGIGRPDKFFQTLKELGADLVEGIPFPDHHQFTGNDIMLAVEIASIRDAIVVTTEKDYVRLNAEIQNMVTPVPVSLAWEAPNQLRELLGRVTG